MEKMKILLGLPASDQLKDIVEDLENDFRKRKRDVNITKQYSKIAITKALESSQFDTLIVQEYLEKSRPYSANELDVLTDKFADLKVVIIVNDQHYGSDFLRSLFNSGIYTALFDKEAYIEKLTTLSIKGRSKADTKNYYGIEAGFFSHQEKNTDLISQQQLDSLIVYLRNEEDISEAFEYLIGRHNDTQNVYICSRLPQDIRESLKDNHNFKRYIEVTEPKIVSPKKDKNSKPEKGEKKDVIKIIKEVEVATQQYKEANHKNVVIGVVGVEKGVGATNVAVNMAYTLADNNHKACLIDLDFDNRDIYYHFNKNYKGCLAKLNEDIDFEEIGQWVHPNLLCFSEYKSENVEFNKDNLMNMISYGKRKYDAVVLDIHLDSKREELVKQILHQCDKILIVVDQQLNVLDRIPDSLKIYQAYLKPADLVINKYSNIKYFTEKYILNYFNQENFFIDIDHCFTIEPDYRILQALALRKPGVTQSSTIKKDIEHLVNTYFPPHKHNRLNFFRRKGK